MDKFDRLIDLVQELRGESSQRQFARQIGVSEATVRFWESRLSWPGTENLQKLAVLKGWTLDGINTYLEKGESPRSASLSRILAEVSSLSEAEAVLVAQAALEIVANKQFSPDRRRDIA
jgi:transcriptional regulator with XRE-family HTH domain